MRRAANARRSVGPSSPGAARVLANARGHVTSTPSRVKGRVNSPTWAPGEAQRDPDQRTAGRLRRRQCLGYQRLLSARRRDKAALVAARHVETGAWDEPPAEVASLQSAPEVLRVDDPDARRHHRDVVDVGAPVGEGTIVQDHAVPVDGLVEPLADVLLTGGAAAPCLRRGLLTGEEPTTGASGPKIAAGGPRPWPDAARTRPGPRRRPAPTRLPLLPLAPSSRSSVRYGENGDGTAGKARATLGPVPTRRTPLVLVALAAAAAVVVAGCAQSGTAAGPAHRQARATRDDDAARPRPPPPNRP